jgi:hypothetical protein
MTIAEVLGVALGVCSAFVVGCVRHAVLVFLAFVLSYVGALALLWVLSPMIWGPKTCNDFSWLG